MAINGFQHLNRFDTNTRRKYEHESTTIGDENIT